jgi:hypothetical protein
LPLIVSAFVALLLFLAVVYVVGRVFVLVSNR